MKKTLFLLTFCVLLASCNKTGSKTDFRILPSPQEFEIKGVSELQPTGGFVCYSRVQTLPIGVNAMLFKQTEKETEAQLEFEINTSLEIPAEGYLLDIQDKEIHINAKDKSGLLYGFATLEQLISDATQQQTSLPNCQIKDYPKLSYRAIHLDVKHHLEKMDYYYKLIDKLVSYKANAIIIEIEDKLQNKRQSIIASPDAYSIDQWKALSDYAHDRNINISPLVQGLGHASFILKHEEYKDLRDNPKSDWAFNPLDPKIYELQFDLYKDALEAFPHGKYLHVGADEVHTTGKGSNRSSLDLQLEWLGKVSDFVEKQGRTAIVWDDMPLKHVGLYPTTYQDKFTQKQADSIWKVNEPKLMEFLDKMPKNCIFMRWNYKDSTLPGNLKAISWYTDNGLKVMGATAGQMRWVLAPQDEGNIHYIKGFAKVSIERNAKALLLTLWDDDSPLFELYTRGILAFAEYTWAGDKISTETYKQNYRHREWANALTDDSNAFIDSLEKPVAFWKNALLKGNKRNYLKRDADPDKFLIDLPFTKDTISWSKKYEKRLAQAQQMKNINQLVSERIQNAQSKAINNQYQLEVYQVVNQLTAFTSEVLLTLKNYDQEQDVVNRVTLLEKIKSFKNKFKEIQQNIETTYAKIRVLNKPENYILDQDHHVHLANQALNFSDWQFYAETLFLEKIERQLAASKQ